MNNKFFYNRLSLIIVLILQNKSSRYANVNIHHHEFSQSSRNVSENEFDDVASNRHNWATSSVPGSLSGKYGNGDQIIEENESLGNLEDDAITKKDTNKHPKRKPAKPISDDGVITTISQQEGASNDDKCSSVMSLSDKYRTQEEIEIFQVWSCFSNIFDKLFSVKNFGLF